MDIKAFLASNEPEAFITGPAGSGKTTKLNEVVTILNELNINYLVTAYTHKAKEILISKLPEGTICKTLHSWLKKRPGINSKAKHVAQLMTNHQQGKPEHLQLLIVDEFSFINEEDYLSIGELQDELNLTHYYCNSCQKEIPDDIELEHDGDIFGVCPYCNTQRMMIEVSIPPIKVLYVGDLNQLSPVKGWSAISPIGPYWEQLTVVHRNTSDLLKPLSKLVDMIEGKTKTSYLKGNKDFIREVNIDEEYISNSNNDKIMLAYTNKAVQEHNIKIQGYSEPKEGDIIYIPTLRCDKRFIEFVDKLKPSDKLLTPNGFIDWSTKYNPLKTLVEFPGIRFFRFEDGSIVPGIFGSYNNKLVRDKLGANLIAKNRAEEDSTKEYKLYKCINDYVSIMDFNHCMTIHKSQGSEFQFVYIDSKDLATCIDINERMKLLYVAISRGKSKVFMNN